VLSGEEQACEIWREKGALREELGKEFSDRGLLGSGRGSRDCSEQAVGERM
jgi:hypothetical protein